MDQSDSIVHLGSPNKWINLIRLISIWVLKMLVLVHKIGGLNELESINNLKKSKYF